MTREKVGIRFSNEKIAKHWQVDDTKKSFDRMLNHIEVRTNFRVFFEHAFGQLLKKRTENNLIILDLGGGVGWTSALMALESRVKKVILVEPSSTRRLISPYIASHFGVPKEKIEVIDGTFQEFNLEVKVDVVVMSASIHHCYDEYIPKLFHNIEACLINPHGEARILIANEHVFTKFWVIKRFGALLKNIFLNRKHNIFYSLFNLRAPYPGDAEHWRTKKEINKIITNHGYTNNFNRNNGDLCIKNPSYFTKIQWVYYYSILDKK